MIGLYKLIAATASSTEIIVSIENGETVKARDFKDVPDNGAWSAEALRGVKGMPYFPTGSLPAQSQGDEENILQIPELRQVDQKETTRAMSLKERHFEKIGYSDGCLKCHKMQRHGALKSTAMPLSTLCLFAVKKLEKKHFSST